MKLYYTGAEFFGVYQNSPLKSLGGLISGSVVPNNSLSNVFPDISMLGQINGTSEVRALVLKNTSGVARTNVYLSHVYPAVDSRAKIEWSPVTIPDAKKMEEINSGNSEPYQVGEWYEPIGDANKILIAANLPIDGVIGLWVRRTIRTPNPEDAKTALELEAYLAALVKTEEVVVTSEYT